MVAAVTVFSVGMNSAAQAQIHCTEPLEPACFQPGGQPGTDPESDPAIQRRCIADIQEFVAKIDEFLECNQRLLDGMEAKKTEAAERIQALESQTNQ